jgi:hypothetical protein
VADADPPERLSGGADFWVYGLRLAGPGLPPRWSAPLVARIPAAARRYDMLRQDSAVQSWAAARGYPAPQVLTVLPPGPALASPVQVMARAPGVPLVAANDRFTQLLVRMGAAHAELHRLGSPPPDARPGQLPDNWLRLGPAPGAVQGADWERRAALSCGQMRSDGVSAAAATHLTCGNVPGQGFCSPVLSVRIEVLRVSQALRCRIWLRSMTRCAPLICVSGRAFCPGRYG